MRADHVAWGIIHLDVKSPKDGDGTTSLGNPLWCLTVLRMRVFFSTSSLNLSFQHKLSVSHPPVIWAAVKNLALSS